MDNTVTLRTDEEVAVGNLAYYPRWIVKLFKDRMPLLLYLRKAVENPSATHIELTNREVIRFLLNWSFIGDHGIEGGCRIMEDAAALLRAMVMIDEDHNKATMLVPPIERGESGWETLVGNCEFFRDAA